MNLDERVIKLICEDINSLNESLNSLIDEQNKLAENVENLIRGAKLGEVRLNKIEYKISIIEKDKPKIKSFEIIPIPKVSSGTKL